MQWRRVTSTMVILVVELSCVRNIFSPHIPQIAENEVYRMIPWKLSLCVSAQEIFDSSLRDLQHRLVATRTREYTSRAHHWCA